MSGYKSGMKGADVVAMLPKMIEVTYQQLKDLRDAGNLIAGMKYRMIDYDTYTSQEGTESEMHPFDLILTALDNKTFSEECSAIQSARDTEGYFASSNLVAWKVWYCLDNDPIRFAWSVGKALKINADEEVLTSPLIDVRKTMTMDGVITDPDAPHYLLQADVSSSAGSIIYIQAVVGEYETGDTVRIMRGGYYNNTNYSLAVGELIIPPKTLLIYNEQDISSASIPISEVIVLNTKGVIYNILDGYNNQWPCDVFNIRTKGKGESSFSNIVSIAKYRLGLYQHNIITLYENKIPVVRLFPYSDGDEHYAKNNRIINSNNVSINGQKIIDNSIINCTDVVFTNGYFRNFIGNTVKNVSGLKKEVPQGGTEIKNTTFLSADKFYTDEDIYNAITATKNE